MKPLWEFCEVQDNHRTMFSGIIGETVPLQPHIVGGVIIDLTPAKIHAIANYQDTSTFANPTLQVLSSETSFCTISFKDTFGTPKKPVKVTHVHGMDGDLNQMLIRLAINITDDEKNQTGGYHPPGTIYRAHPYPQ